MPDIDAKLLNLATNLIASAADRLGDDNLLDRLALGHQLAERHTPIGHEWRDDPIPMDEAQANWILKLFLKA